jgi:hypothetical protein
LPVFQLPPSRCLSRAYFAQTVGKSGTQGLLTRPEQVPQLRSARRRVMSQSDYIEEIDMSTSKVIELGKVSEETKGSGADSEFINPVKGLSG